MIKFRSIRNVPRGNGERKGYRYEKMGHAKLKGLETAKTNYNPHVDNGCETLFPYEIITLSLLLM